MEPNKKQINRYIKQVFITTCWGDSSLSTNSDFTPIPYEVVLCINTKGNSERQKNPAAREFTPSSFLIQVPGSSCSLHLGPCPPELPRTGSLLTQVSARGHLLREASLTAPTGGTISPIPFYCQYSKRIPVYVSLLNIPPLLRKFQKGFKRP